MKKWMILLFLMSSLLVSAQSSEVASFKVGYLNKEQLLQSLPQIEAINKDLASMQKQYDKEYKRMQDEYNQKVKIFLENEDKMQQAIRLARQTEITEYELRLRAYEKRVVKEMAQMKQDAYAPILAQMHLIIKQVAQQMSVNIVLDASTPLYMDENCVDMNLLVFNILKPSK